LERITMSNDSDLYTLAEADRELRRRTCETNGHDFAFQPRRLSEEAPAGITCMRCGWMGSIVMDEKP
jgi:hypothetical protein